jgi:hypothetical protein
MTLFPSAYVESGGILNVNRCTYVGLFYRQGKNNIDREKTHKFSPVFNYFFRISNILELVGKLLKILKESRK